MNYNLEVQIEIEGELDIESRKFLTIDSMTNEMWSVIQEDKEKSFVWMMCFAFKGEELANGCVLDENYIYIEEDYWALLSALKIYEEGYKNKTIDFDEYKSAYLFRFKSFESAYLTAISMREDSKLCYDDDDTGVLTPTRKNQIRRNKN